MTRSRHFVSTVVVLLAACGERGPQQPAATRDSAGVEIVESRFGEVAAESVRRVAEAPAVEIGSAPGAAGPLYQVVSAFRMHDGRIVVASAGTGDLRVYAPDGQHLLTIGKAGDGPGEFRRLFWAGRLRGDSIGAWDAALARLSVFDPSGRFVRSMTPSSALGVFPQLHAALADGSVVLSTGMNPARPMTPGVRRDTATLLVVGPDGVVRDTLARVPGSEQYLMIPRAGGFVMHPLPFGRTTSTAAQDSQLAVGTGDAYQLAVYEPRRGLRRIIRLDRERRRVTDDDVRRYRETMVTMGAEGARRQREQLLAEVPFPERMPAFTAVLPDGRGNWWIADPPAADRPGESTWHRVSAEGRLLGALRTPARLMVMQIGPDWVLGVFLDENDVEHVRIHTLER
jgi:hypothetical protein